MSKIDCNEKYELCVENEDILLSKLHVCEQSRDAILDLYFKSDSPVHHETVKEIIQAIHSIELRIQTDLIDLRLEKTSLARLLRQQAP